MNGTGGLITVTSVVDVGLFLSAFTEGLVDELKRTSKEL
jgi:hypothetical protein